MKISAMKTLIVDHITCNHVENDEGVCHCKCDTDKCIKVGKGVYCGLCACCYVDKIEW